MATRDKAKAKKKKKPSPVTLIRPPVPVPLPLLSPTIDLQHPDIRLWTKGQVLERVPLSYPTIWKRMREGTFPRSRYLGPYKTVWLASEVEAWILSAAAAWPEAQRRESSMTKKQRPGAGDAGSKQKVSSNDSSPFATNAIAAQGPLHSSTPRLICRKCKRPRLPSAFLTRRGNMGAVCKFCKSKILRKACHEG